MVDFTGFDEMSGEDQEMLLAKLEREAHIDDGEAVHRLLNAGHPIYYKSAICGENELMKEYPNGKKTRVTVDNLGVEILETT